MPATDAAADAERFGSLIGKADWPGGPQDGNRRHHLGRSTGARGQRAVCRPAAADERIDPVRVVAFLAMCFGMFMAFLDIQVVSASLSEIQAGLAASSDEITWVQTSYLMAEVVAIPLSGFLSRALGTRIMFATAGGRLHHREPDVRAVVVHEPDDRLARAAGLHRRRHGADGVRLRLHRSFPRPLQPVITPMIGLVATLAPTIGPTVGGYLTDMLSWHWLFFINIVPGIVVTIAAITLIDFDKPNYSLFERFDLVGLIFMALFLGALEYVLEDGPRYDWFEDSTISFAAIVSATLGGDLLRPRAHGAHSRSSICAPLPTAISRSAACSPSCSASAFTA